MPDPQPPWRALRRLHTESQGEGVASRVTRSNAMQENFRRIYGWHRQTPSRIESPPQHHQPHTDYADALPIRRVEFPLFEIASSPAISLSAIRERRFNLFERGDPRPAMIPEVERLLKGLALAFTRPRYRPPPPPPERPRLSRWEVLAA